MPEFHHYSIIILTESRIIYINILIVSIITYNFERLIILICIPNQLIRITNWINDRLGTVNSTVLKLYELIE